MPNKRFNTSKSRILINNNQKKIFSYTFFVLIIIFALKVNNAFLTFLLFSIALLWDKCLLISILLITPVIETVLVLQQGLTVTKLLIPVFSFLFLIESLSFKNQQFDKNCSALCFFALITFLGVFNSVVTGDYINFAGFHEKHVFNEFFSVSLSKIIFTLMLYLYFKFKGAEFLYKNLILGIYSISSALILICIYFILKDNSIGSWWGIAVRLSFEGADPNEFSGMLSALAVFPLTLCLTTFSKKYFFLGIISIFSVILCVLLTLSRGGILTFCFMCFITFFIFYKKFPRRVISFSLVLILVMALGAFLGLINYVPMYDRFVGKHINDLSSLTAGRSDLLKIGIKSSIEKPFLGYGGTQFASQWISYFAISEFKVMHNLYLEILIQYGLIGLSAFFLIVFLVLFGFISLRKIKPINNETMCFFIPYIALASLLFSSLALSWQWREILWYLIGLALVTSYFTKGYRIQRKPSNFKKTRSIMQ